MQVRLLLVDDDTSLLAQRNRTDFYKLLKRHNISPEKSPINSSNGACPTLATRKGDGSYRYKVCKAGSDACSNIAGVVF
jgi:hypothetical protein